MFVCVGCDFSNKREETAEIENHGDDNYICLYQYDCKSGVIDEVYRYNDSGFLSEEIKYRGSDKRLFTMQFMYDDMGNISECVQTYDTGEKDRVICKYDTEKSKKITQRKYIYSMENNDIDFWIMPNLPIESTEYTDDKKTSVTTYEYDKYGNETSGYRISYLDDKEEEESYTFERSYDEAGNIIVEKGYHDGVFNYHYGYEYDENGNKVKEISYKKDGMISSYYIYKYDDKNNLIEYIVYKGNGTLVSTIRYTYDGNGNKKVKEHRTTGEALGGAGYSWENYEYDENGNLIHILEHNSERSCVDEYQYDEAGNVIRYIQRAKDGSAISDTYYKWVLQSDYLKNKDVYEKEISDLGNGEKPNIDLLQDNETKVFDEKTIEELAQKYYGNLLSHYKNYAAGGFNGSAQMINLIYSKYNLNVELYYTLVDLANDGIPELFISDGNKIYDTYAIFHVGAQEKQIVPLVLTEGALLGDRTQCEICEGNIIKVRHSGGYMSGEVAYWTLNVAEYELTLLEGIYGNGINYYYGTDKKEGYGVLGYYDEVLVTEEDYRNMDEKYSVEKELIWCKLSEFSME